MHIDRDATGGFDALLTLIAAAAVRSIAICCKCCPHLGRDKAWLLQLVGLLQQDRLAAAAAILADGRCRPAATRAHVCAAGLLH